MIPIRASLGSSRRPSAVESFRRLSQITVTSPMEERPRTTTTTPATAPPENGPNQAITEEINEIKRYEDFTTIDWVQDAVNEQARRRVHRTQGSGFWDREGTFGWRRKVRESYDAGQAWLVVTIVGVAIGLNSAFLNIVTEWLADIKLGYCTTAFYLNEQFCCWGAEGGMLHCNILQMVLDSVLTTAVLA